MTKPITRKTPVSKNSNRVDRQLMNRAPKKGDVALHFDTATGKDIREGIDEVTSKKASKSAPAKSEVTKRILSKISRAYKKAGGKESTEAERTVFTRKLLEAGVPVMARSSARIARVLKGEIEIADLKVSGRATVKRSAAPKKAATNHIAEQPISAGTLAQLESR
jgi:hypothetical protein